MTLSLKIALRYLLSRKSHGAVNVISSISVAGVAVATAAIVVVLSVFNGFTRLARSQFSLIDPQLLITAVDGRVIVPGDSLAAAVAGMDGVKATAPVLSGRALAVAGDAQLGVVFIGAGAGYTQTVPVRDIVAAGEYTDTLSPQFYEVSDVMAWPAAPAVGVLSQLGARAQCFSLYVPRRVGRINPANAAGAFREAALVPTAMLQSDRMEFDADHIIIPIDAARELLEYYDGEATAINVALEPGVSDTRAAGEISRAVGPAYRVATRDRQQEAGFRMIAIEKWVTFMMLAFILVIAAFNIVSTLSLMVIEKRDNMATLRFLGAPRRMVRRVFMLQGALITVAGGIAGIILGTVLALAQQYGGFIRLGGDPDKMTLDTYPVEVSVPDLMAVAGVVVLVAAATSLVTLLFTRKIQ